MEDLNVQDECRLILFARTPVPGGHGADDYESDAGDAYVLTATANGQAVGALTYNDVGDTVRIRWCEVESAYRRRGVATALHLELARLHPEADLTTGGCTVSGDAFLAVLAECHGIEVVEESDPDCD